MSEKLTVWRKKVGSEISIHLKDKEELSVGDFTIMFGYIPSNAEGMVRVCYVFNGLECLRVDQLVPRARFERVCDTMIDVDNEEDIRNMVNGKPVLCSFTPAPDYEAKLCRYSFLNGYTAQFTHQPTGFLEIEILTKPNDKGERYLVLRDTNRNWDELDEEVYKRAYEKLQEIVSKKGGTARPDTIHFNPQDEDDPVYRDRAFDGMYYTPKKVMENMKEYGKAFNITHKDTIDLFNKTVDKIIRQTQSEMPFNFQIETGDKFDNVLAEMSTTHKAKNHDYGNSFTDLFKELGMTYAYGHLKEKLERVHTLMGSRQEVKKESMLDSLYDLASYAVMTIVELKKKDGMAQDKD